MVISALIEDKSFGAKRLFDHAELFLETSEKVGLIGRNGEGKTTLFHILAGQDSDFQGELMIGRGVSRLATEQEHHYQGVSQTVLDYILQALPGFERLKKIIETYPDMMGDDMKMISVYSEALEEFESKGYYTVESTIERILDSFGLPGQLNIPMDKLSGGQKRLVEVAKIMTVQPDLCLIDEPTNHMDFYAKQQFINWLNETTSSVLVITHDRDVLDAVVRIVELKDKKLKSYRGDYQAYLRQNMASTSNQMNAYETMQRRIENLKGKVIEYQRLKERARDPGTIQRFKRLEAKSRQELAELQENDKPTFWVDQESAGEMKLVTSQQYSRHKAKNIRLHGIKDNQDGHSRLLIDVQKLSLGFDEVLFNDVTFQIREGEKVELRGRNGAGKSTLINSLLATATGNSTVATVLEGAIEVTNKVRIGVYQQDTPLELLNGTLAQAIEKIYLSRNLSIGETKIRQLMSDYLFWQSDAEVPVRQLSGGQKARLQLITMLANDPSLLVLDEPTNHLDLPSIEELEQALGRFSGAILYVSHDTYFRHRLGGQIVELRPPGS